MNWQQKLLCRWSLNCSSHLGQLSYWWRWQPYFCCQNSELSAYGQLISVYWCIQGFDCQLWLGQSLCDDGHLNDSLPRHISSEEGSMLQTGGCACCSQQLAGLTLCWNQEMLPSSWPVFRWLSVASNESRSFGFQAGANGTMGATLNLRYRFSWSDQSRRF